MLGFNQGFHLFIYIFSFYFKNDFVIVDFKIINILSNLICCYIRNAEKGLKERIDVIFLLF